MGEKWQQFFGKAYMKFSRHILTDERTAMETEAIIQLLSLPSGAHILDAGCGMGRLSVPLAQRGYAITGLDGSAQSLRQARADAEAAGVAVRWIQADMRDIPAELRVDAVINMGTAFGYVQDEADDCAALRAMGDALKPGGALLMDMENRDFKIRRYAARTWDDFGGDIVRSSRWFDPLTGRWREEMFWSEEGEPASATLDIRLYSATEMRRMLTDAGFHVAAIFGGLDGSPLTIDSIRMVIVARKEGGS